VIVQVRRYRHSELIDAAKASMHVGNAFDGSFS
jgi:hypothetical protein